MKIAGTWIKMGARNLRKNRRRSFFTMGALALGFTAVNIFGGYTAYIFTGVEEGYIYAHANGHLTVFKDGFLEAGSFNPMDYLLTDSEIRTLKEICRSDPRILLASPQLQLTGLISNGEVSTIFVATGAVPSDADRIRSKAKGFVRRLRLFDGNPLTDEAPYGVGLSRGLARKLDLSLNSSPVVVAPTADGQMNALDAQVFNVFDSPYEVLNGMVVNVSLTFAQELYDTTSADRLVLLLQHAEQTRAVKRDLERRLADEGLAVDIRTWEELCPSYTRILNMFNVIFALLFTIVFVIVVLSVVNTISTAVLERTREIGTLRALGLKRRGALAIFATESALLGLFGSAAGLAMTIAVWCAVKVIKPQWYPPMISAPVSLEIYLVPEYIIMSLIFLVLLAMCAAVLPARRAARMGIIDALGHV